MRGRGHGRGRRAMLVTATVLTAALLGAAAHADLGTSAVAAVPAVPGQGDIDRATAAVPDRQSAADQIQAALDAADTRLHDLQARAGFAAEAYDTAVAQAAAAAQASDTARTHAAEALAEQQHAERRLGVFAAEQYRQGSDMAAALVLLQAGSMHDFAVAKQALANRDAAEAQAVTEARRATKDAATVRQQAEQTAADQRRTREQAQNALDAARAAAADAQSQVAVIQVQRDGLLARLAAAQGVEVGLERQREAGLAALAAHQAASRQAVATSARAQQAAASVHSMLTYIYAQLGKPYVWGGAGPDVFDCSGLAMRGLEAGGWSFPHPAQWQYLAMHPLTYTQLRPGDLVFWAEDAGNPHTIYHEAVYIGGDRIIQAPRPGGVVEQQSLWINGTPSFYGRP